MRFEKILTAERLAVILLAAAVVGTFSCGSEPVIHVFRGTPIQSVLEALYWGNTIVFNLSVGILGGLLVWFLVSWLPEYRRRHMIRDGLAMHYRDFKGTVILNLLMVANGSGDTELSEELLDHRRFQAYFKANHDKKWYAALNGLQGSRYHMGEIATELELLAAEVRYVLTSVPISDREVHQFFRRLNNHIFRLRTAPVFTSDEVKYLGNFLWGILARWDFVSGQRQNDVIADMIAKI